MRRILLLLIAGAILAAAAWYVVRIAGLTSNAAVATLLPRDTILLIHVPNFNRTRDQWHRSDLYQLYREPAVQDFLRKPITRLVSNNATSETVREIEQLDPKDAFVALISMGGGTRDSSRDATEGGIKFAAGFRFRGNQADAEKVIAKLRSSLFKGGSPSDTVEYQRHKIEIVGTSPNRWASAYDGDWFFASNDLAELKVLLDRADRRSKDREATLEADESFRAASAHMLSNYSIVLYLQPNIVAQQIQSLRAAIGSPVTPGERTLLEQVNSVCGTMRFDGGKIHDLLFVGIPKLESGVSATPLTRSSLALGTKETFLYLAMLLNIGEKIDAIGQAAGLSDRVQRLFQSLGQNGITADDWKAGFGLELGTVAEWPQTAHWPSMLVTLPVIDIAKANKIVEAATRVDEDSVWARTEKDGVRYFSMQSPASLIPVAPTIALSNQILIAGLDAGLVERAVALSRSSDWELSSSQSYRAVARSLPAPTNFFAYVDTALLYTRLDATVRPLVMLAAAFAPGVNEYVELDRFPEPETVTKHLSPIVSSQRYDRDGYVIESVGPVTLNQAAIGVVVLVVGIVNDEKARSGLGGWPAGLPLPAPTATP